MESNSEEKEYAKNIQYATTDNLNARYALHKKYTPEGKNIWDFVWQTYGFSPNTKLLEVGCGFGAMWTNSKCIIPENFDMTLTDFSEGMLTGAQDKLSSLPFEINFELADVEQLPYQDDDFDVVLAHYMLYHTEDKAKALSEIRRVLKDSGWAGIILNSADHMAEIENLAQEVDSTVELVPCDSELFTAEYAEPLIQNRFSDVQRYDYKYEMFIDDASVIVEYAKSSGNFDRTVLSDNFWNDYKIMVENLVKEIGYFSVNKHSVLFVCKPQAL